MTDLAAGPARPTDPVHRWAHHEPEPDDPGLVRPEPHRSLATRVGDLADATGVTPARLVGGAATALLVAAAAAWALRPPPSPVELDLPYLTTTTGPAVAEPAAAPGSGPHAGAAPVAEEPAVLVVHVAGAVAAPGVHRLEPGARVVDAVAAAGGLRPDADDARVNLAAPVADGERVYVPRQGEDAPPEPVSPSGSSGSAGSSEASAAGAGAPVDLNRATAAELEALPGVGPATAAAILEHRTRIGAFTSVEQLIEVRGIGPAKLEQLRPLVRV